MVRFSGRNLDFTQFSLFYKFIKVIEGIVVDSNFKIRKYFMILINVLTVKFDSPILKIDETSNNCWNCLEVGTIAI